MIPQTVSEVIERLQKLKEQGYGDHILLVSNDEECNGYHELYGHSEGLGEPLQYYNERTGGRCTTATILFN